MKLFTIGFTKRTAEDFFCTLQQAGIKRVVDIRLNNSSQLAAFAKSKDLEYFLRAIADIEYVHMPLFSPTPEILDAYKKNKGSWEVYERDFKALMEERHMGEIAKEMLREGDCLLCSEPTPEHCHRRLVAEHLLKHRKSLEVVHL